MKKLFAASLCLLCAALAAPVASSIRFEEVARKAGLTFTSDSSPTPNKNQPETMVAGVALIDYDNDGYLDVYLVNGAAIPSLGQRVAQILEPLVSQQSATGNFSDVTEKAGVQGKGYGMGVAVGDYDNDGWPDIFLANVTSNQLYRNNRDGTFTDVTDKAGLAGAALDGHKMWSVAAGWFDYDNDGRLDLFVSNYCKWEVKEEPFCGPESCYPLLLPPEELRAPSELYLSQQRRRHVHGRVGANASIRSRMAKGWASPSPTTTTMGSWTSSSRTTMPPISFSTTWAARSSRRWPCRRVWPIRKPGAFISGMGAEFRDVDNDGWEDIWHTAIEGETFPLFKNRGTGGDFLDMTRSSGLVQSTRDMSGWSNASGRLRQRRVEGSLRGSR